MCSPTAVSTEEEYEILCRSPIYSGCALLQHIEGPEVHAITVAVLSTLDVLSYKSVGAYYLNSQVSQSYLLWMCSPTICVPVKLWGNNCRSPIYSGCALLLPIGFAGTSGIYGRSPIYSGCALLRGAGKRRRGYAIMSQSYLLWMCSPTWPVK